MVSEVNPQKVSPNIKSNTWSYPQNSLVNWKRALFIFFYIWPSKATLIQTRVLLWHHIRWETKKISTKNQTPFTCSLKKAWLWHQLFFFTLALRKWTNFHTFQTLYAMHSMISQLMSHPPARLLLMVITPGGFDVHRFILTKNLKAVKFKNILKSLLWSLVIFAEAVTPVCSSGKYFHRVTHVPTVAGSPAKLICPLSCAASVFASMTHFTFLIKKDGKAGSVFKQQEKGGMWYFTVLLGEVDGLC